MAGSKSMLVAYVLWLFGGYFGLHHFYLRRDRQAFAYWCTLGGGLFLGWIRDFWRIPSYVASANEDVNYTKELIKKIKKHNRPPFSLWRFMGQMLVGYVFGFIFYCAVPFEEINGYSFWLLTFLTPLAISIGVHLVGNIGHEQGVLKKPLYSSAISWYFSYNNMPGGLLWCVFSASTGFTVQAKQWRRTPSVKRYFITRFAILFGSGVIFCALLMSGLYFNAEIIDKHGERIKFRDSVGNFLQSPLWDELKDQLVMLYNFYKAHGWKKMYDQLVDQLDPHGERRALKTLGLSSSSTKQEIIATWRKLSKEWHPDRIKDPDMKLDAQTKFMEYQGAYQALIKIRGKIRASKPLDEGDPVPDEPREHTIEL